MAEEESVKSQEAHSSRGINTSINQNDGCSNNASGSMSSNNIRRYLVLLQDCLAIKFVSISHLNEKKIQQNVLVKSHSSCNFPSPNHRSLLTGSCHCCCSQVGTVNNDGGNSSNPVSSNSNQRATTTNQKGKRCDWKSSDHQEKPAIHEESNRSREDHQECQYHQTRCTHNEESQPKLSCTVKGSNDSKILTCPIGDQVNQQTLPVHNNSKLNKSISSVNNNEKRDYEVVGHSYRCSGSGISNDWESDLAKRNHHHHHHVAPHNTGYHFQKNQKPSPSHHHYDYLPQPNEHLLTNNAKGTSLHQDEAIYIASSNDCKSINHGHFDATSNSSSNNNGSTLLTKMDHSMQALFLYKEFREINLQCFWNTALHEAFKSLEYKGSVVPATIIVGAPIRKHITVLKTAWSRKMLRSPSGYFIDFLGEIEELIADPIAKSHFVPLSDSLCWAIHELTSSGQEAFVDDIFSSLATAFPGMALPTKELIYQTLEKLTRERKIYQTAQGYFVVTPDTHRYIMSTEPLLVHASHVDRQMNSAAANFLRNSILLRQALNSPSSEAPNHVDTAGISRDKPDIAGSTKVEEPLPASPSPDPDTISLPYGTFRRYNSLRIRKAATNATGCLPRRTLSMRLPKSKSKSGSKAVTSGPMNTSDHMGKSRTDVTDSFQNLDSSQPNPVNEQLLSRRRKHKSFLSRLLSFRGVRKSGSRKEKSGRSSSSSGNNTTQISARNVNSSNVLIGVDCKDGGCDGKTSIENDGCKRVGNVTTTSTQTSLSFENLNGELALLSLAQTSKASTLDREDSDSGRCTDSHSDADAEIAAALNRGLTPIIHHHHHHHHDGRRRDDAIDDHSSSCNVYEKIESDLGLKVDVGECDGRSPRSPSSQMSVSPSPSTFTSASATAPLSRGFNNSHRQNIYSRCHSSASSSGNSYRDFYNLYRRRYPSYQQSPPTSLESPELYNEGVRFKPNQPFRYPPRSFERKQIFDEMSRNSFREKKYRNNHVGNTGASISNNVSWSPTIHDNKLSSRNGQQQQRHESCEDLGTITYSNSGDNNKRNHNGIQTTINGSLSANNHTTINTNAASPTTTILTQTLKNSTNLELEFRLPLGNIITAAMGGGNSASESNASSIKKQGTSSSKTTNPIAPSSDKLSSERPLISESNQRIDETRERECPLTEVSTMVNDLFTIKSLLKTSPFNDEVSSTIEFQTRDGSINNNSKVKQNCNNNSNNNNVKSKISSYVIEAVSSKPVTTIHTKFNRESEII